MSDNLGKIRKLGSFDTPYYFRSHITNAGPEEGVDCTIAQYGPTDRDDTISVLNTSYGEGGVFIYVKGNGKSLNPPNQLFVDFNEFGQCRSWDAFLEGNCLSFNPPPGQPEFENYRGKTTKQPLAVILQKRL